LSTGDIDCSKIFFQKVCSDLCEHLTNKTSNYSRDINVIFSSEHNNTNIMNETLTTTEQPPKTNNISYCSQSMENLKFCKSIFVQQLCPERCIKTTTSMPIITTQTSSFNLPDCLDIILNEDDCRLNFVKILCPDKCDIYKSHIKKCSNHYPTPKYYDKTNTSIHLIPYNNSINSHVLNGSYIQFVCRAGYYVDSHFNSTKITSIIKTVCLTNGSWSIIPNCKPYACWNKLPSRPLNGRRITNLFLNWSNGLTNGSYINFTCNPYYELIGQQQVSCINGKWEKYNTQCVLSRNICSIMPPPSTNTTYMISMVRERIIYESSFNRQDYIDLFTVASYTCLPQFTNGFTNKTSGLTKFRVLENENGRKVLTSYQNVSCIGYDKFDSMPVCY
jgi:hypothetical protein